MHVDGSNRAWCFVYGDVLGNAMRNCIRKYLSHVKDVGYLTSLIFAS